MFQHTIEAQNPVAQVVKLKLLGAKVEDNKLAALVLFLKVCVANTRAEDGAVADVAAVAVRVHCYTLIDLDNAPATSDKVIKNNLN